MNCMKLHSTGMYRGVLYQQVVPSCEGMQIDSTLAAALTMAATVVNWSRNATSLPLRHQSPHNVLWLLRRERHTDRSRGPPLVR